MALPNYGNNLNDLKVLSACFSSQCLGEKDRLAIEVINAMRDLAVVPGGQNYSVPAILKDAALWIQQLAKTDREAIACWIDLQNAIYDGAQFPNGTGINGLKKDAKCLLGACTGAEELRNLLLFLKWRLNKIQQEV